MTREALEERIKQLEGGVAQIAAEVKATDAHAAQLRQNLAMTSGALEECKSWLASFDSYPTLKAVE
jgi:hypothetical protein